MPAQKLDFDKLFADRIEENLANAVIVEFNIGGQEWHATNTASAVALLDLASGKDPSEYLYSMVVPEERDSFRDMLMRMRGMDTDMVIELVNQLSEKIASVPTRSPSVSSATSRSRTSGGRSTGRSSSKASPRG